MRALVLFGGREPENPAGTRLFVGDLPERRVSGRLLQWLQRVVRVVVFLSLLMAGVPPGRLSSQPPGESPSARRSDFPLSFDSELIKMTVDGDSVTIDGTYWFVCRPSKAVTVSLFYPYPIDSLLGRARTLLLIGRVPGGGWKPLEFAESPDQHGACWQLRLGLGDTMEVRTVYRQALKVSYARYIVTTTSTWGRPLRYARFEIRLPAESAPLEFSYPFTVQKAAGDVWYLFEASEFQPDRDIIVRWRPRRGS